MPALCFADARADLRRSPASRGHDRHLLFLSGVLVRRPREPQPHAGLHARALPADRRARGSAAGGPCRPRQVSALPGAAAAHLGHAACHALRVSGAARTSMAGSRRFSTSCARRISSARSRRRRSISCGSRCRPSTARTAVRPSILPPARGARTVDRRSRCSTCSRRSAWSPNCRRPKTGRRSRSIRRCRCGWRAPVARRTWRSQAVRGTMSGCRT